jgi:Putative porin
MFQTGGLMLRKKLDAGWGVLPLAASLCVLTGMAPAFGQSAPGAGAPMQIQPATQPQTDAPKILDKRQSDGSKSSDKQQSNGPKVSDKKPTAPNAVVNLVNILVKKGVLKEDQAQELIKEVDDETYVSQQATKDAKTKADEAAKAASAAAAAANPPGTRHVTYVPEVVKQQLREEIKREVMAKAERENWASPGAYPEWASRIHFYGDFRLRNEDVFFPKGNDPSAAINFNAINTGPPYLTFGNPNFWPTYDVSQNRQEFLVQARLGMHADILDGLGIDIRIATGNDPSPVSTNQVLGYYNTSN